MWYALCVIQDMVKTSMLVYFAQVKSLSDLEI